jgi:hypothetical protein
MHQVPDQKTYKPSKSEGLLCPVLGHPGPSTQIYTVTKNVTDPPGEAKNGTRH